MAYPTCLLIKLHIFGVNPDYSPRNLVAALFSILKIEDRFIFYTLFNLQ